MTEVIKRNGKREHFDISKIAKALEKVYNEVGEEYGYMECLDQAHYMTSLYHELDSVDIEAIQDDVEMYLMEIGEYKAARAYISYREKRKQVRDNPWNDLNEIQSAVIKKYLDKNETKKEFLTRMSMDNPKLYKKLVDKKFIFAGRINAAYKLPYKQSGSNCYVQEDPEDNLLSIHMTDYKHAVTYSRGGGSGCNLSNLRPTGAFVNNAARATTGVVSFADQYSETTLRIGQKNRRGALMLMLNSDHPDIINWIKAKLDIEAITGANLSIYVQDELMAAAKEGKMWKLHFETEHEKIEKWVDADDVLSLMAFTNWWSGDPGMFFGDRANSYHLLSEYPEIHFTCTNPCGEQPLLGNGSCNLASLNLSTHIENEFSKEADIDLEGLKDTTFLGVEALDNMLDYFLGSHPLPEQNAHIPLWREIGLGMFGYADVAVKIGMEYGSKEFIDYMEPVMKNIANWAAQASALIAKEKGTFEKYDYDLISQSEFFQTVYTEETKEMIRKYGLRNSRLLSIAPNGSIATLLGASTGGEPYFKYKYTREIKSIGEDDEGSQFITVVERTIQDLMNKLEINDVNELPEYAKTDSHNIKYIDRIKFQAMLQKYIDTAISATINLPHETKWQDIKEIYFKAWEYGLKGITTFRDGCAKVGILVPEDAKGFIFQEPAVEEIPFLTKKDIEIILKPEKAKDFINSGNLCPECGSTIIKKGGCTGCSNCEWSKCSI